MLSPTLELLGTSIGVGPSFDAFGLSIPLFFYGTVVPEGDSLTIVPYPAQINLQYPIISELPVLSELPYWPHSLTRTEQIGAGYLQQEVERTTPGEQVTIIGMSGGAQVAELVRASMTQDAGHLERAEDFSFVLIGDPYEPNGGILARFTSWADMPILGDLFPLGRPGPADTAFETTYYRNQYDGVADFPAYFAPLALANAAAGIVFQHNFPGYVLQTRDDPNAVSTTVGNTTYVTFPQHLPLLEPLRIPATLVGAQSYVDALDVVLRVLIERAYERTADPSVVLEFGWHVPQQNNIAARDALPAAIAEAQAILAGAQYTPTLPQPGITGGDPTPVTEHPIDPVDMSPEARAVRQLVEELTQAFSTVTQLGATVLRTLSGATGPEPAATDDPGERPAATALAEQTLPEPPATAESTTQLIGSEPAEPLSTTPDELDQQLAPRTDTAIGSDAEDGHDADPQPEIETPTEIESTADLDEDTALDGQAGGEAEPDSATAVSQQGASVLSNRADTQASDPDDAAHPGGPTRRPDTGAGSASTGSGADSGHQRRHRMVARAS